MSPTNTQYITAAVTATGVLGGAYYAYKLYKNRERERVIVIPDNWTNVGKLSNIYLYPIKSCGPVIVERAECSILGLRNSWLRDRVLMVVDEKNNFLTARAYPELLKVFTSVQGSVLTLRYEGQDSCHVNLAEVAAIGKQITATVWGTKVKVQECGFESGEWFSRVLKRESLRLVYYTSSNPRPRRNVPDNRLELFTKDDYGALPDEVPYNLINESSIEDLNFRLERKSAEKITHRNFRPNFVITGTTAFAEDNCKFIKIGQNIFEIIKPCTRCVMTTMDPETGIRDTNSEPLNTLKSYRQATDEATRRVMGSSPRMGVQMALRSAPGGLVSIGDDVYFA